MARRTVSAGRALGRKRDQLLSLLRSGRPRRPVPLRRRRQRASRAFAGSNRVLLARVRARHRTRTALRFSSARSVVIDPRFDWGDDRPLRRPLHETVIYEMHVKGFSKRFPDIPEAVRGTYAGLAHPASIAYLTKLGVTAVELLPVHQFVHDSFL